MWFECYLILLISSKGKEEDANTLKWLLADQHSSMPYLQWRAEQCAPSNIDVLLSLGVPENNLLKWIWKPCHSALELMQSNGRKLCLFLKHLPDSNTPAMKWPEGHLETRCGSESANASLMVLPFVSCRVEQISVSSRPIPVWIKYNHLYMCV